jgi:hypothetical protein
MVQFLIQKFLKNRKSEKSIWLQVRGRNFDYYCKIEREKGDQKSSKDGILKFGRLLFWPYAKNVARASCIYISI